MSEKTTPQDAPAKAGTGAPTAGQSAGVPAPEVPVTDASPTPTQGAPLRESATATPPAAAEDTKGDASPDVEALRAQLAALEAKQAAAAESSAAQAERLKVAEAAMRAEVLERLGVLPKFREFAPSVDAYTADGRAALEKWASENPELLSRRPSPTQDMGVKVEDLTKDKPGGWLVRPDEWNRKIRGAR